MTRNVREVASVALRNDQPTELSFLDLYTWVIWQFPRKKGAGLCGAVRPPLPNQGWLPALIRAKERRVIVHGHLDQEFSTPTSAADWLATNT